MIARVVTEAKSDAALLTAILSLARIDEVDVLDAGSKSSAKSLGTSFALGGRGPVAVVLDADTSDQRSIEEQKIIFDDLQPNPVREKCRLFLAVPTLASELFPDARALSSTFGTRLDQRQIIEFEAHRNKLVGALVASGRMQDAAIDQLVGRPLIADLLAFLRGVSARRRVGAVQPVKVQKAASA